MNVNSFGTKVQQIIVMVLVVVLTILIVFYGYLPDNYNYSVGSISEKDIYASRTITDTYQTQYDALQAKNSVAAIFVKSSERSEENINSIEKFFKSISSARDIISKEDGTEFQKTVAINTLKSDFQKNYNTEFDDKLIELFLGASASIYRVPGAGIYSCRCADCAHTPGGAYRGKCGGFCSGYGCLKGSCQGWESELCAVHQVRGISCARGD